MNRKVIITLIIFMILVMTSLILVQTYSLTKAFQIREEQFDQTVSRTLKKVIDRLEAAEVYKILTGTTGPARKGSGFLAGGELPAGRSQNDISISFQYSQRSASSVYGKEELIQYSGSLSIESTERGHPGDFPSAFDLMHEQDNYIAQQFERRMQDQAEYFRIAQNRNLMTQLPLKERISQQQLEHLLRTEFRSSNIDLNFKYAVKSYSQGSEQMIFGSRNYNPDVRKEYREPLFPRDLEPKGDYLRVYFPKRDTYLLRATGVMLIPTIILTAMLIGIFTYTIMIILKQKKLSMIKNDFINNMTHELKTPISTISLASQMLHDNSISNSPKMTEHISSIILQESKRLSFQVEKVLQMAIFNEGRLKLKFKEIHFHELINNVIHNFELRVKSKDGKLEAELLAGNDLIKGDEVHLTNVIFNLFDNAVKYSREKPEIQIRTENKNGQLLVSVKDNGIGIAKEHLEQIFERFFRVPTGNVHDVKGFGLGLSYVKKIVESHQGKIKAESVLNKGTKFVIFFPLSVTQQK